MGKSVIDFFEKYGEDIMNGVTTGVAGVLGIVFAVVMTIALIIAIGLYILRSMGLYTIAKRRGLRLPGMAWVPIGSEWLVGSIADQFNRKARKKNLHLRTFLLIGGILVWIANAAYLVFYFTKMPELTADFWNATPETMIPLLSTWSVSSAVSLITTAFSVFYYIAVFKMYRSCTPGNTVWMLVLSIIFGTAAESVMFFCIRRKDDGFIELQRKEQEEYGYRNGV